MKLKNKLTGEIVIFGEGIVDLNQIGCKNVAEMIEAGWEDYEEPKGYWYYDTTCGRVEKLNHNEDKEIDSSIGNCFETKEEAEKAVEKLKAWKRLKDKGFRFERWYWDDTQGHYILEKIDFVMDEYDGAETDLDLLFGGEE